MIFVSLVLILSLLFLLSRCRSRRRDDPPPEPGYVLTWHGWINGEKYARKAEKRRKRRQRLGFLSQDLNYPWMMANPLGGKSREYFERQQKTISYRLFSWLTRIIGLDQLEEIRSRWHPDSERRGDRPDAAAEEGSVSTGRFQSRVSLAQQMSSSSPSSAWSNSTLTSALQSRQNARQLDPVGQPPGVLDHLTDSRLGFSVSQGAIPRAYLPEELAQAPQSSLDRGFQRARRFRRTASEPFEIERTWSTGSPAPPYEESQNTMQYLPSTPAQSIPNSTSSLIGPIPVLPPATTWYSPAMLSPSSNSISDPHATPRPFSRAGEHLAPSSISISNSTPRDFSRASDYLSPGSISISNSTPRDFSRASEYLTPGYLTPGSISISHPPTTPRDFSRASEYLSPGYLTPGSISISNPPAIPRDFSRTNGYRTPTSTISSPPLAPRPIAVTRPSENFVSDPPVSPGPIAVTTPSESFVSVPVRAFLGRNR